MSTKRLMLTKTKTRVRTPYRDTRTFYRLFNDLDQEIGQLQKDDDWESAGEIVRSWKKRFLRIADADLRAQYLEMLESRYWLLFHGEYIPEELRILARELPQESPADNEEWLLLKAVLDRA